MIKFQQLTRNPEEYRDRDSLPHVQVAARINSTSGKKLRAGDIVYYVICLVSVKVCGLLSISSLKV